MKGTRRKKSPVRPVIIDPQLSRTTASSKKAALRDREWERDGLSSWHNTHSQAPKLNSPSDCRYFSGCWQRSENRPGRLLFNFSSGSGGVWLAGWLADCINFEYIVSSYSTCYCLGKGAALYDAKIYLNRFCLRYYCVKCGFAAWRSSSPDCNSPSHSSLSLYVRSGRLTVGSGCKGHLKISNIRLMFQIILIYQSIA